MRGDEVPGRQAVTVAEVGKAVEAIVLVAVFDPYLAARHLARDVDDWFQDDVPLGKLGLVRRHTGQVVVVIPGKKRDFHLPAGLAKLGKQFRMGSGDVAELRHPATSVSSHMPKASPTMISSAGCGPSAIFRRKAISSFSKWHLFSPASPPMCISLMK